MKKHSKYLILILLFSFYAQGTGIKRVYLPKENLAMGGLQDNKITLSGDSLPSPYDPVEFNTHYEIYKKNQQKKYIHTILIDMLRTNTVFTLYQMNNFNASYPESDTNEGLILLPAIPPQNGSIDEVKDFFKKYHLDIDMKFLVFTYLLYNKKIPDQDILNFIDFINLPEDYVFTGKILNNLEADLQISLLDVYSQNKLSLLGEEQKNNVKILQHYASIFFRGDEYKNKTDTYPITTLSHEIAFSSRVNLIEEMIKDKKLNPKAKDFIGNTFLHALGYNKNLTGKNWKNIQNDLIEDSRVDFNIENKEGYSFLTVLVESGIKPSVEFFVKNKKGNIFIKDVYNRSLLQIAAEGLRYNIASYLYKEAGDKLNELSYLNGYVTNEFQHIVIQPVSYFYMEFLTKPIYDAIKNKYRDTPEVVTNLIGDIVDSIGEYSLSFSQYENLRTDSLQTLFLKDTIVSKTLLALRAADINTLKDIVSEAPDIMETKVTIDVQAPKVDAQEVDEQEVDAQNLGTVKPDPKDRVRLYLTDMLIEAIRYNQPDSVRFVLDHTMLDLNIGDMMQPLPAALMTSFLIDWNDSEEREKSSRIIHMLIDLKDRKVNLRANSLLDLEPIELASLAGLLDVVKKLHEEYNIPLPMREGGVFQTDITYADIATSEGFKALSKYYKENLNENSGEYIEEGSITGDCSPIFH